MTEDYDVPTTSEAAAPLRLCTSSFASGVDRECSSEEGNYERDSS